MNTKRLFRMSLQFKVAAVLLTVLICASALAGTLSMRWISRWLHVTATVESGKMTEAIAAIASDALQHGKRQELQRIADRTLSYPGVVAVSLLHADGTCAVTRISPKAKVPMLPIQPESVALAYERHISRQRMIVARPVLANAGGMKVVGALRLAIDTTSTEKMLNKAALMTWSLAAVVVTCMFPLANLMLRRIIIQPVHRLAGATRRVAAGDYSVRVPMLNGSDDLSVLGDSFNLMAERIESQHEQLVAANENLEGKVRRRTAQLDRANLRIRRRMDEHLKFLRAVSHDLNAPLRNIAGIADLTIMKWSADLPREVVERLERIRANVNKESELINDLLEISRLGAAPVRPEPVDLGELLESLKGDFEYDLNRKSMTLTVADAMPVITADANHMRKLFQNLIDNAVKYMPADRANGHIAIDWRLDQDDYVFEVADNGPGIDESDREKIFTVFRRGSRTGSEPGKGVGLASVAAIAARYDGSVEVDGEPGEGATFRIRMSRTAVAPPAEQETHNAKVHTDAGEHDDKVLANCAGR